MMLGEVDEDSSLDVETIEEVPSVPSSSSLSKKPELSVRPPTWGHKPNTSTLALTKCRGTHQDHSPPHLNSNKNNNRLSNKVKSRYHSFN